MVSWGRVKSVSSFACYAVTSITAGRNSTKFAEKLAYTSGLCKTMFIFGAPRLWCPEEG